MQTLITIDDIRQRARTAGIPYRRLALKAGVSYSHLCSVRTNSPRLDTVQRLFQALIQLETERRDYLLLLHPVAARQAA